jgi:hypothetical protein
MYILQNISSSDDIVRHEWLFLIHATHLGTHAQLATSMLGTPRVHLLEFITV